MKSLSFECEKGHRTDGLYRDDETFQGLLKGAKLECTQCFRPGVKQALSMPHVNSGISREKGGARQESSPEFRYVGEDMFDTAIRMASGREAAVPISGILSEPEAEVLRDIGMEIKRIGNIPPSGRDLN